MNFLNIGLGGHNLTADDLMWAFAQHTSVLTEICKTTQEPLLIISGCEVSIVGPNITWTAGLIFIDGEVCEVLAGSTLLATNDTWVIDVSHDPLGDQVYEDLNPEHPWVLRRALIHGNTGGSNLYTNATRLKDLFMNNPAPWVSMNFIAAGGSWVFVSGLGAVAGFRTAQSKRVELNGEAWINSFSTPADDVICQLPVGPDKSLTFLCPAIINSVRTYIHVEVLSSGEVKPHGLSPADNCTIFLETINYPTDWSGII